MGDVRARNERPLRLPRTCISGALPGPLPQQARASGRSSGGLSGVFGVAGVVVALSLVPAEAYAAAAQGKIVCWKDAAGKVIGCGDKVPPEYQDSGTRQLDSRGVTRGTTESTEEVNKRRLKEQEAARVKAEEQRKSVDQKRQDTALLDTYSNEKEIDLKRDRDLGVIDLQIEQLAISLKNATQRYTDTMARVDAVEKSKKPLSTQMKDELTRATTDKERFEKGIEAKNQEKEALRNRYADQRRRYVELRSNPGAIGAAPAASTSPSASASPSSKK
jgi:hypothetical protein